MERSKRREGGSVRNDSRILSVGSVQIDIPVRFSSVRMEDFSSFPGRFAEKVGTTCGEKKCFFSRTISRSAESDFSFSARCAPKLFRKGNPEAERGRKRPFEGGLRRYLKKIRFAKTESKCSGYSRPADRPTASFRIYFLAAGRKESKNKSMLTAS